MNSALIKEFHALRLHVSVRSDPGSRWPRLIKEFRALLLPWLVGLAAGLVAMLYPRTQTFALVAGVGCAALLAAMSMGEEFQQRTLALLLSQPRPRRDLWREKLLVLGTLAGTLGLVLFVSWGISLELFLMPGQTVNNFSGPYPHDMLMIGVFFVAVVCSAPLCTLEARSILGGLVFSVAISLLVLLLTASSIELWRAKVLGPQFEDADLDSAYGWAWLITGLIYSGACLLAGRRKFGRLELKDSILGESTNLSSAAVGEGRWWDWLRIRPTGSLGNLVRKELRLQKPVFVVAAVFSVCWLAVIGLHTWGPEQGYEGLYEALRLLLPGVYIPLVLAVAAAISLGEEHTLGLAAWHLTLPVSARRQWLLKLGVGAAVAIGLGLVLPGLVGWATLPEFRAGLDHTPQVGDLGRGLPTLLGLGTALWVFFVLSFWAATMLGSTMRAVSTALLGVGALWLCCMLSAWSAEQLGGLEKGLLCDITAWWQLPFCYFFNGDEAVIWGPVAGGLVLSLAALAQSLVQFRRAQVQRKAVVRGAALLLAIALLAAFWIADFRESATRGYGNPLFQEVSRAVRAFPNGEPARAFSAGITERDLEKLKQEVRRSGFEIIGVGITERDLERVAPLSARAKRWLRGATIELDSSPGKTLVDGREPVAPHGHVTIDFPNVYRDGWDYGAWIDGRWR